MGDPTLHGNSTAPGNPADLGESHRRRGLTAAVVVAVTLCVTAVVLVAGRDGAGDDEATALTKARPSEATTSTAESTTESTTTIEATTTTESTSTTEATTTTLAAPTLPAQQTEPVAPPVDQRGAEAGEQIGSISIGKIGLDSALLEGIRLTTLDKGPGHWPGSAMPGQVGNVVVAGHRTSHNAEFRKIDQLAPGDIVTFTTVDGTFDYAVTGTQVVGPDALWIIDPSATPTATLFACHPPGSTRQRIVVNLALV